MSIEQSIWQSIIAALRTYVKPIQDAVEEGPGGIVKLLGEASIDTSTSLETLLDGVATQASLIADKTSDGINSPGDVMGLVGPLLTSIETLSKDLSDDVALPLLEHLSLKFIWNLSPQTFTFLVLNGVIDETQPSTNRLNWVKLENIWQPRVMMRDEYGWGKPDFDGNKFLLRIANVAMAFGAEVSFEAPKESAVLTIDPASVSSDVPTVFFVQLFQHFMENGGIASVGFETMPVSGKLTNGVIDESDGGIAISPNASMDFPDGELGSGWSIHFNAQGNVSHAAVFRPSGLNIEKIDETVDALRLELGVARDASNPWGLSLGSGFEVQSENVELTLGCVFSDHPSLYAEFKVQGFEVSLKPDEADGFLAKILPKDGLTGRSDFTIEWSPNEGFQFTASAGFETHIPLHRQLGPVRLIELGLGGYIADSPILKLIATLDFSAELGPINASVSGIGVLGNFDIVNPKETSNNSIGPFGIDIGFLPPTGAGLSVDAEIVLGGGFIKFDEKNERYDGILALSLSEISITAIGLITTKMPDGSKDFSCAICMYLTPPKPIEISMGFTLSGVGGMVGINRAMVIEELQKGVRKGTLNSILFPNPKTIVAKAPQIIEDIRRVFPPAKENFVVGPMLKFGWGSPNVIQADIGIFLVLPDLSEMALLGKLNATFPTPKESIIKINMYLLGTLSRPKKELTFQTSIYDSEILKISLWGDIAFLLRWSDPPEFTMAMGGFHPKFTPPPPEYIFGDLKRLSLNITWGSAFYLLCQSYIALTPNSLQFGAKLQLIINLEVIKVYGGFSFDVLFYFNPFSFMIDADVYVGLSVAGVNLLDVKIDLHLSGPTPWNARGSAIIHLLFFDVNADFDVTWGDEPNEPLLPAVDPLGKLKTALEDNHNWSARLPHTRSMVEALQPLEADGAESLVVHPAGSLEVIQNVLPLGVQLKKFGNAPITGHDKFMIRGISFNGQDQENPKQMITEHLNRGAYEKLSKHDKLSKPSFEKMTVGANFSSDTIVFGGISDNEIPEPDKPTHGYESSYINQEEVSKTSDEDVYLNQDDARLLIAGSAAARSKQLTGGDRKFVEANMQPRINKVNELSYAIADIENLTRADIDVHIRVVDEEGVIDNQGVAEDRSLWHVEQVLEAYIENTPGDASKYIVVAEYELEEAA